MLSKYSLILWHHRLYGPVYSHAHFNYISLPYLQSKYHGTIGPRYIIYVIVNNVMVGHILSLKNVTSTMK
jgi:hypothetical protein